MERRAGQALNMQGGKYLNGCFNVIVSVDAKDTPEAETPSYDAGCYCFCAQWLPPIPCCCCPKEQMELLPLDADNRLPVEEGKEVCASS